MVVFYEGEVTMRTFTFVGMLVLLCSFAFASSQSFPNTITISTSNYTDNQTILNVNITTEENSHIYNVHRNMTESFTFNLQRNITSCDEVSDTLANITTGFSSLVSTCDSITKAYGDTNRYYQLYASCNVDKTTCDNDLSNANGKISELDGFRLNYNDCVGNLNIYQNQIVPLIKANLTGHALNLTQCGYELRKAESSHFIWFIAGALIVGFAWAYDMRKKTPPTKRSKMLSGLNR